jgi:hypothetical protein
MDAEQIRREMSATRASIDRKLDLLAVRTAQARQDATRATAAIVAGLVGFAAWSWWRRRAAVRRARSVRKRIRLLAG